MLSIKSRKIYFSFLYFVTVFGLTCAIHFTDVTSDVFVHGDQKSLLAAFGDFNSDKLTDVFYITDHERTLGILFGHSNSPILDDKKFSCSVGSKEKITSVMPGDFNGDSMMDVLITVDSGGDSNNEVRVFWGSLNSINCTQQTLFTVRSQPLLMDFNGDMIPDIFAEHSNGSKFFWVAQKNGSFSPQPFVTVSTSTQKFKFPHSNAFVDLDFDNEPDLLVTGETKIEYFGRENGDKYDIINEFDYPSEYKVVGQSLFLDLDGDGQLEHLMPVCKDEDCQSCALLARVLNSSEWQVLHDDFKKGKDQWCFRKQSKEFGLLLPLAVRSADLNMDGTPDFLAVLDNKSGKSKGKSQVVVMINSECVSCPFGRKLDIMWDIIEGDDVLLATAFDLYEDGILDILLTVKDGDQYKMKALQNKFTTDAYFIKILVVGGLCYYDNCPKNHIPYGVNQPGPLLKYKTLGPKGHTRVGCAAQLPQSAHFPLLLPYTVFGLGQTPNFVDELEVIVPGSKDNSLRQRQLTQIIPNSQIVIIPYPPDKPKYWTAKLFVTPSHLVLLTFAALIGTCIFICMIIGGLHWKERRQDKRERLLEAHRFHFDAM